MSLTRVTLNHVLCAQFGEGRVLWKIFGGRAGGYFIEVGAYDGVSLSNTYFLEQLGWRGLLIEPILELCRRAAAVRPKSRVIQAACGRRGSRGTAKFTVAKNVPVLSFLAADADHVERCLREGAELEEIEVPLRSLSDILMHERRNAPVECNPWKVNHGWAIDLATIDTEGCELDVLDGFNLDRFRPRILVMENDRPAGAAIEPYLAGRGYRKFHRQKINDFYVRCDDPCHDLTLTGLPPCS